MIPMQCFLAAGFEEFVGVLIVFGIIVLKLVAQARQAAKQKGEQGDAPSRPSPPPRPQATSADKVQAFLDEIARQASGGRPPAPDQPPVAPRKPQPAPQARPVQKDMAQRMMAVGGDKEYSSFSVICQYRYQIRSAGDLQPGSFYPKPEVISTIVEMIPAENMPKPLDSSTFFSVVRALFSSRRKTIRNNLRAVQGLGTFQVLNEACEEAEIDLDRRGEEYDVSDFIRLADVIYKRLRGSNFRGSV